MSEEKTIEEHKQDQLTALQERLKELEEKWAAAEETKRLQAEEIKLLKLKLEKMYLLRRNWNRRKVKKALAKAKRGEKAA